MLLKKSNLLPIEDPHFHLNNNYHFFPYLHNHDFYEIFVVLSGKISHSIHDKTETLTAGNAALIYPQDEHLVMPEGECLLLNLACSGELMNKTADFMKLELPDIPRRHLFLPEETAYLLGESKRVASTQDSKVRELLLQSLLVTCLSRFIEEPVLQETSCPEWFSLLLARLSLPEVFTKGTREICALSGYTPEYVSRCFRKYLATTLTEYTQERRIRYACGLLSSTDLPIVDICYECGFANLSHFYHCFQKINGISPKRYRDHHKISLLE